MSQTSDQTRRSRPALLSLILLAMLLASVLAAQLLSSSRARYSRRGAKIVEDLRGGELGRLWKSNMLQFYTISRHGQEVGWEIQYRTQHDQMFDYVSVEKLEGQGIWEHWDLSSNASTGAYQAGFADAAGPSLKVTLSGSTVHVDQVIQSSPDEEAPANYLPLDMLPAAVRVVAAKRERAYFRTHVTNLTKVTDPAERETLLLLANYVTIELDYGGRQQVQSLGQRVDVDVVQLKIAGLGAESSQTFYVDSSGTIVRVVQGDIELAITDLKDAPREAAEALQQAALIARRLQDQQNKKLIPLPFGGQSRVQREPRLMPELENLSPWANEN